MLPEDKETERQLEEAIKKIFTEEVIADLAKRIVDAYYRPDLMWQIQNKTSEPCSTTTNPSTMNPL